MKKEEEEGSGGERKSVRGKRCVTKTRARGTVLGIVCTNQIDRSGTVRPEKVTETSDRK